MSKFPLINPQVLEGNWDLGRALDFHNAVPVAPEKSCRDLPRTPLGELLYRLKFKADLSALVPIVEVAESFVRTEIFPKVVPHVIIPAPPAVLDRPFQPVEAIARSLGERLNIPVDPDYFIRVRDVSELKTIPGKDARQSVVRGAFALPDRRYAGMSVLLLDDLVRFGTLLDELTALLKSSGAVGEVAVLTITKVKVG